MMNKSIWTTTNPGHGSNHSNGADPNSLLVCTEHNKFTPYSSPTEILVRQKWFRVILVRTFAEHQSHDERDDTLIRKDGRIFRS